MGEKDNLKGGKMQQLDNFEQDRVGECSSLEKELVGLIGDAVAMKLHVLVSVQWRTL